MAITLVRGEVYRVRLTNGSWYDARFIMEKIINGYKIRSMTVKTRRHFMFQNLDSGRDVEIKSMVRIRAKV